MVVCNGRKFMLEPEWTRVRPSLKQKSIIDYYCIVMLFNWGEPY